MRVYVLASFLAFVAVLPARARLPRAQMPGAPVAPVVDVERVRRYQERVATSFGGPGARLSLADVLPLVMRRAEDGASDARAADEHRAALFVLAFYVNNWPLEVLVPDARGWPRAQRRTVVLRGRQDLARHFAASAAVSSFAGTAVANAIGLSKEMDDARRTSGFSFSDLAADRAGTLFGQMATGSRESAERLQVRLRAGLTDNDIMPALAGLPDNLPRVEFTRRYGGVGEPAYQRLVEDIDRRVAALSLFQ